MFPMYKPHTSYSPCSQCTNLTLPTLHVPSVHISHFLPSMFPMYKPHSSNPPYSQCTNLTLPTLHVPKVQTSHFPSSMFPRYKPHTFHPRIPSVQTSHFPPSCSHMYRPGTYHHRWSHIFKRAYTSDSLLRSPHSHIEKLDAPQSPYFPPVKLLNSPPTATVSIHVFPHVELIDDCLYSAILRSLEHSLSSHVVLHE